MRHLLALALTALTTLPAAAWGQKGHYLANEAATFAVPYELPRFFHESYPGLVYLGYDPDRLHGAGASADDMFANDHFLDWEYVAELDLPRERYEFLELLGTSGTLRANAIDNRTTGFLPWRIAETCEHLERQWQLWKRAADSIERGQIEENIVYLSGVLGHFVADAANPHHATIHYNGWVGAENPERFRSDCEAHRRFESDFVTRHVAIDDVVPLLHRAMRRDDYFLAATGFIRESHALVPALYRLDRDGAFDGAGSEAGKRFAAERIAAGASWLRDLWWTAYLNGTQGRPKKEQK
ncbi:MAG: hypothetical protein HYU52_07470 [Acidobacteria bacterium]|nr:hypothetical protein [Acidobacteriota bacterium]